MINFIFNLSFYLQIQAIIAWGVEGKPLYVGEHHFQTFGGQVTPTRRGNRPGLWIPTPSLIKILTYFWTMAIDFTIMYKPRALFHCGYFVASARVNMLLGLTLLTDGSVTWWSNVRNSAMGPGDKRFEFGIMYKLTLGTRERLAISVRH